VASPDGKSLLFMRNPGNLARLDLESGEIKLMRNGWDDELEYVYSPDGALIAFAESDQDFNKDIWIMAADGSKSPVNVTRHPDNELAPRFSADGKILAFLSERTNEEFDVWMVNLDRDLDGLSQRDLDQYFKDAAEAAKKRKPLEVKGETLAGDFARVLTGAGAEERDFYLRKEDGRWRLEPGAAPRFGRAQASAAATAPPSEAPSAKP
jgi:dipeptidyl aminopeptidase/acylaminoacyl peptidase